MEKPLDIELTASTPEERKAAKETAERLLSLKETKVTQLEDGTTRKEVTRPVASVRVKTKSSNFRLPEGLLNDLQVLALILDRSQTDIVKEALEKEVEAHRQHIDQYNNQLKAIQDKLK